MKLLNKAIVYIILVIFSCSIYSCKDFDEMTNPNEATNETFWVSEESAIKGVNAIYAGLQRKGTYRRWFFFVTDVSSELGMSTSPWTDLANVSKFTYTNYNFEVNYEVWQDHYRGIFRANQVLQKVPGIEMDTDLKNRLLAEAKFLRALYYYNLVNLYGNVPLATEDAERLNGLSGYPQVSIDTVYKLIEEDLIFAMSHLPTGYESDNSGRATWGAATSLLAKAYMQQHKYEDAEPLLKEVVESNIYELTPRYSDNFRHDTENNVESIFEVQFSDEFVRGSDQDGTATSSLGCNRAVFFSPVGWSDAEATSSAVDFFKSASDPRLDATFVYENSNVQYYGMSYAELDKTGGRVSNWFRKYLRDYYKGVDGERGDFDSPINYRVIRFSDILLLYAEALNENGKPGEAVIQLQKVRDRVEAGVSPFNSMSIAKQIEYERILELAGESQRFFDLRRYGYFDNKEGENSISTLQKLDNEFNSFRVETGGYLPIPTKETDLNLEVKQNNGW